MKVKSSENPSGHPQFLPGKINPDHTPYLNFFQ